ncbi:MAG TPA: Hpt domain-containing protein [Bacteroidaceae bacterium]|nr:Hpt domain-containing protein [Bacteroidaceae bacterium]
MIINLDYLKTLSGGNEKFIREMVDIFKEQIAEYAEDMPKLLETADYDNLSKLAHKAKSSAAIMGMTEEADSLAELEILAREGKDSDLYVEYIDRFVDACHIALKELNEHH